MVHMFSVVVRVRGQFLIESSKPVLVTRVVSRFTALGLSIARSGTDRSTVVTVLTALVARITIMGSLGRCRRKLPRTAIYLRAGQ